MRSLMLLVCLLVPSLSGACEYSLSMCETQVKQLIAYRMQAIEYAFGELQSLPNHIDVEFVAVRDERYARYAGRLAYERESHRLIVPRRFAAAKLPNPLRAAAAYWPFYQDDLYLKEYPIVGAIDNAIWSAYLEEAAQQHGAVWPHKGCSSIELGERLPCEMLMGAIAEFVTTTRTPLFNENRLDRIWPDDFADFQRHVARNDSEYRDVQHYGGILLVRPLIGEFGVPKVLAYLAQTPFRIEGNSVKAAALAYQQRARQALSNAVNAPAVAVSALVSKSDNDVP